VIGLIPSDSGLLVEFLLLV